MRKSMIPLLLLLLLCLSGCNAQKEADGAAFYFLATAYTPGESEGIIVPEAREVSASKGLGYTIGLYLEGPVSEELRSPFPSGVTLVSISRRGDTLHLILSPEFWTLQGLDRSLALGCLARTCFALSEAQVLHLCSPDQSSDVTLDRDSFVYTDQIIEPEEAG